MIRILAAVVWPFVTLDAYLTDRRIRAAEFEHARETAAIEAPVARHLFPTAAAGRRHRPRMVTT